MKRICVVVTARPSWSKLEPVCAALKARPDVELQIVACASALLERYGRVVDVIRKDYDVAAEVWSTYEGANLLTSAQETGALVQGLSVLLHRLRPDIVLVCADRHEVLGAAQAAAYTHTRLAHMQGGERSGSIDDRVRDSITALADVHFPCTELAAFRVYTMTGSHQVYNFGCPSVDVAKRAVSEPPVTAEELGGAGRRWTPNGWTLAVLQHPVTDEADHAYEQMWATLEACWQATDISANDGQVVVFWPGQDAGADGGSKAIRDFQAQYGNPFHTVRNLPPNRFLRFVRDCIAVIGNSSCGIRESAYLGVPVVDIGSRQSGRQRGKNVVWCPHDAAQIASAIQQQIAHGPYPSSELYGSGTAGERIAEVLSGLSRSRPVELMRSMGCEVRRK